MSEEKKIINEEQVENLASTIVTFDSKSYIETIKNNIKNGEVNPLSAMIIVKRMAKVSEEVLKDDEVKKLALDEAEKYLGANTKTFQLHCATISKAATYTWYDFKSCNHPVLEALELVIAEATAHKKRIEEELKLLIPPEFGKAAFGVMNDTKPIKVEHIPFLKWEETEDEVTVQAPVKRQTIGLKFNKI